jgi:hypothetical protein
MPTPRTQRTHFTDGPAAVLCGAMAKGPTFPLLNSADPSEVTCGNCKRRMPRPPAEPSPHVPYTAEFHDNPAIDACPECGPAVALILDANPDADPSELALPDCSFCEGLRLVYVQNNTPPAPENSP